MSQPTPDDRTLGERSLGHLFPEARQETTDALDRLFGLG